MGLIIFQKYKIVFKLTSYLNSKDQILSSPIYDLDLLSGVTR